VAALVPSVHRSSVYRTLDALTAAGLLQHVHLGHLPDLRPDPVPPAASVRTLSGLDRPAGHKGTRAGDGRTAGRMA
jgi:hypothetical protein